MKYKIEMILEILKILNLLLKENFAFKQMIKILVTGDENKHTIYGNSPVTGGRSA